MMRFWNGLRSVMAASIGITKLGLQSISSLKIILSQVHHEQLANMLSIKKKYTWTSYSMS